MEANKQTSLPRVQASLLHHKTERESDGETWVSALQGTSALPSSKCGPVNT